MRIAELAWSILFWNTEMREPIRVKPERFKEWNEAMVRKYDPDAFHHHPNPFVRLIEGKRVKSILRLMDIRCEDDHILEIGCGAGNVLEQVHRGNLWGIDISASILGKAKQKLSKQVTLLQADAQSLPFKDQAFKQLICSEVLEHLLEPLASLEEMARVLNRGGVVVVSVPNELWINRIKRTLIRLRVFDLFFCRKGGYERMPENMEDEWHLHAYPIGEWLALFSKSFRVSCVKRIPFFCLPLRYVIRLERK